MSCSFLFSSSFFCLASPAYDTTYCKTQKKKNMSVVLFVLSFLLMYPRPVGQAEMCYALFCQEVFIFVLFVSVCLFVLPTTTNTGRCPRGLLDFFFFLLYFFIFYHVFSMSTCFDVCLFCLRYLSAIYAMLITLVTVCSLLLCVDLAVGRSGAAACTVTIYFHISYLSILFISGKDVFCRNLLGFSSVLFSFVFSFSLISTNSSSIPSLESIFNTPMAFYHFDLVIGKLCILILCSYMAVEL